MFMNIKSGYIKTKYMQKYFAQFIIKKKFPEKNNIVFSGKIFALYFEIFLEFNYLRIWRLMSYVVFIQKFYFKSFPSLKQIYFKTRGLESGGQKRDLMVIITVT